MTFFANVALSQIWLLDEMFLQEDCSSTHYFVMKYCNTFNV